MKKERIPFPIDWDGIRSDFSEHEGSMTVPYSLSHKRNVRLYAQSFGRVGLNSAVNRFTFPQ